MWVQGWKHDVSQAGEGSHCRQGSLHQETDERKDGVYPATFWRVSWGVTAREQDP